MGARDIGLSPARRPRESTPSWGGVGKAYENNGPVANSPTEE